MKIAKRILIALAVYVGIVIAFESMIGILQPETGNTLVITTMDENGAKNDRVLARLDSNGQIFVSANHWPRAWYSQALANPNVRVTLAEGAGDYLAVPVTAEETERLNQENPHGLGFRFVTGFPPRYFIRLEPRG